jgi:hypothetical protein
MKSIKRGRGPSFQSGIASIAVGIFGVIWTISAASMGGGIMALFGIVFIGVAVSNAIYSFKNATGQNRYSEFDIVDEHEEPDPLNAYFGADRSPEPQEESVDHAFCPYCGSPVQPDFDFCSKCGKKLPE